MNLPRWLTIAGLCTLAFWQPARLSAQQPAEPRTSQSHTDSQLLLTIPRLTTNDRAINDAFRIAIGDLAGNISLYQSGLLDHPVPVVLAGLDYGTPWTRDASINAWNGVSLIAPDAARNTLLAVLKQTEQGVRIGGQYWDSIVWATGAWHHYLYTGDRKFLALALQATRNTLTQLEANEWNGETGLFRGPGWSDGVAGYPLAYGDCHGSSSILDWPQCNPEKVSSPGYGIPMQALSTNCLYYNSYIVGAKMAHELGVEPPASWARKAAVLKQAINRSFWLDKQGYYRYLVGPLGDCDHQEGLGLAYALLFGIANDEQAERVFANVHVTPAGFPCEWPSYPRYEAPDATAFARHAGTVWPQIQGFWAEAAARAWHPELFAHELRNLARHLRRDRQFAEIYHPLTGKIYGGMQEAGDKGIILWEATSRQTWAATAYLRMVLLGLVGIRCESDGIRFQPCLPSDVQSVHLQNLRYRHAILDIHITGPGMNIQSCTINNRRVDSPLVPAESEGMMRIVLQCAP